MLSSASFRSRSRRSAFVADVEATPPPPNLEPARFCVVLARTFDGFDKEAYLIIHSDLPNRRAYTMCITGDNLTSRNYGRESKFQ
jgi:hypothetical protein